MGHVLGDVNRFDERDTVFARIEGLQQHPETKQFDEYYQNHPEYKEYDHKRKDGGFPVGPSGTIDNFYPPTKAMVEANGGSIGVQSRVGKGTTFTIKIPKL